MFVWSKHFAVSALILFTVFELYLISQTTGAGQSAIRSHTVQYILVNYMFLMVWAFIWMFDQARLRGANLWLWAAPYVFAPLPTLLVFILFLQRRQKART